MEHEMCLVDSALFCEQLTELRTVTLACVELTEYELTHVLKNIPGATNGVQNVALSTY